VSRPGREEEVSPIPVCMWYDQDDGCKAIISSMTTEIAEDATIISKVKNPLNHRLKCNKITLYYNLTPPMRNPSCPTLTTRILLMQVIKQNLIQLESITAFSKQDKALNEHD